MKRTLIAAALTVIFVMALAVPAFAQMTHTAAYQLDGTINFEKQAGHKCNTGAEIKQTITGNGVMDKVQTVNMIEGRITMEDDNNWVAGATPLTVTTVWDLCAPPKYVYTDDYAEGVFDGQAVPVGTIYGDAFANLVDSGAVEAINSNQIWAVQVQADPGFSGNLSQSGVAAYGPYGGSEPGEYGADEWGWKESDAGVISIGQGEDYVGNYFDIEQHARTSQGTVRRYIDLSSPFSHAYVMENMSVVGRSDISDVLSMMSILPGSEMPGDWWNLF
ncbi:MAG: hypothetical protein SCJ94_12060 [Bacillota bacterium]|nr:hypothetical protein [Bacillota bacterium]